MCSEMEQREVIVAAICQPSSVLTVCKLGA
jgi:hypothetical protein